MCAQGQTRCTPDTMNSAVQTCDDKGNWGAEVACAANTQTCIAGTCVPCAAGTQDCNGTADDLCEVNLNLDTSCGTTCANQAACSGNTSLWIAPRPPT